MGNIKIILADAHKKQAGNSGIQQELQDVQHFFDDHELPLKLGTINLVILRGIYSHVERTLTIASVFVNKTGKAINGMKGTLDFSVKEQSDAKFSELDFDFPKNFLGKLDNDEGFILHLKVPVQGLEKGKEVYNATELTGQLKDAQVQFVE